jgi:circadian clock protein KaiC
LKIEVKMKKQNKIEKLALLKKVVSKPAKVTIRKLPTGVQGLDEILGGGMPEFSFNIIGGAPGSSKTTMAHQIRT